MTTFFPTNICAFGVRAVVARVMAFGLIVVFAFAASPVAFADDLYVQQGPNLLGSGAFGNAKQGSSTALSEDGNTAIVGGPTDNGSIGAAWVFTRSGTTWTQQGGKLVGSDSNGLGFQGTSVALSADGNTAIVGGYGDNIYTGAAWIYTRSGGVWTQQGSKLVGSGAAGSAEQGYSVALSADGNTAIVGGPEDALTIGAVWIFTRSGGVWTQQGSKLIGSGFDNSGLAGLVQQGWSVALSADGNTALVGAWADANLVGAAWVFTRSGGVWTQQGGKLASSDAVGAARQGHMVDLSADGDTAAIGGIGDNAFRGAAWVFTRSAGVWTQQSGKLVGSGMVGRAHQGIVSLSGDGNILLVGGSSDDGNTGASWVFRRSGGVWTQQGSKLVGSGAVGNAFQGRAVALSGDGLTALVGGDADNGNAGAVWPFRLQTLTVAETTDMVPAGPESGPFSPTTFDYTLQASRIAVDWQITGLPDWLDASVSSGTTSADNQDSVQFTVNTTVANAKAPGTYNATITVTNLTDGAGTTTRQASLTVGARVLTVAPATNITAGGNVGGPFTPGSFDYQLSAGGGDLNYAISGVPSWLTASSTPGTVAVGTPVTVAFTVNASANAMSQGVYGPATITFTNTSSSGTGTTTRTATLAVNLPAMAVAPTTQMSSSGNVGGPFAPASFQYTLSAVNAGIPYTITGVPSWLTASSTAGTISTASPTTVTFTVNASANLMAPGAYGPSTISFTNTYNHVGDTTRQATLTVGQVPSTTLVSSVLPSSRSVQVGNRASAFATVMNSGSNGGINCKLTLGSSVNGTFDYQTTDPATNARTGSPNTPVNIGAGGSQTYVFGIAPSAPTAPIDVPISALCANAQPPEIISGVNTLLLSASATPVADIVALAATQTNDGIVNIPGANGTGVFAVASVNVGSTAAITVTADTGSVTLPVTVTLCQSNAQAQCTNPATLFGGASASLTVAANATPTFSVFVKGSGTITDGVAFDPATNRVFVRFKDSGGVTRGSTSVAVRTQ